MADNLLPCPFCGDDGEKGRQSVTQMHDGNKFDRIICRCCGAMCPEQNWNQRAAPAADAPAIEMMERQSPEDELRRLVYEEERAHRERMAPYYKALANIEALRQPSPVILSAARIADGSIRADMAPWNPESGFRSSDPEGY